MVEVRRTTGENTTAIGYLYIKVYLSIGNLWAFYFYYTLNGVKMRLFLIIFIKF